MTSSLCVPLPACRTGLIVRPLGEGGRYVAKEPRSGAYYQLGEEEHFLLGQLDGKRSARAIGTAFAEHFGQPLSTEELNEFVEMARTRGLLEESLRQADRCEADGLGQIPTPGLTVLIPPSQGDREGVSGIGSDLGQAPSDVRPGMASPQPRQSILYWRKRIFNPDHLFSWLAPKLRIFWTPAFLAFSAGCILVASTVFWLNRSEVAGSFVRALNWETAVLTWVAMMVVTTLHESAHGLTCKRYGGEVREIGFLLIYLQPAFYCNVSDAWLLPEKSKRLLVTFAGAYFELFVWALAVMAWRVTDTDTWLNHLAFVVMAASGLATLFNFNPLIKLDGYYLLSDYLEIPNLRQRAFRYLGDCALRLFCSLERYQLKVTPRERRVYLVYGLLAWTYSVLLLGATLVYLADRLTTRYQAWGLAMFVALLGIMFQSSLGRFYRRVAKACAITGNATRLINAVLQHGDPGGGSARAASEASREFGKPLKRLRASPPDATGMKPGVHEMNSSGCDQPVLGGSVRRWLKRLVWLLLCGALLAMLFLVKTELRISGQFTILPLRNADVRPEVEGIIEEILVDEGDRVNVGTSVARLSDRDARAELLKTQAQIEEQQARLRLLRAGSRPQEIEVAKTLVAKANERLNYSRARLEMDTKLHDAKLLSLRELQESQEAAAVCTDELQEAQGKLNLLLAGSRIEDIQAVEAELARLKAQEQLVEDQLQRLLVISPISGVVTTHRVKEKTGQNVKKGEPIMTVHELTSVTAEIAIPEKEIGDVKVGQEVVLKARAYPEKSFVGTVASIAPIAKRDDSPQQGQRVFLVTTRIQNDRNLLTSEMTGNARVYCGERRLVDLLTRRFARYVRVEVWSWW